MNQPMTDTERQLLDAVIDAEALLISNANHLEREEARKRFLAKARILIRRLTEEHGQ